MRFDNAGFKISELDAFWRRNPNRFPAIREMNVWVNLVADEFQSEQMHVLSGFRIPYTDGAVGLLDRQLPAVA